MAECNWCDTRKWFFQLDKTGVCAACAPEVQAGIKKHTDALASPEEPAADADWQTWLAHYDAIRSHLSALLRYEGCGIPSLDPAPSAAMVDNDEARAQVILAAARDVVEAAGAQAETAASPAARAEVANGALAAVKTFQDLLGEPLPEFGENNATVLVKLEKQVEELMAKEPSR